MLFPISLCSCYPWEVLGLPPIWYKSAPYRSRAVKDPRGVLSDFGVTLPKDTEVRVWDSTAETRFIVLPMRPAGTEGWSEVESVEAGDSDKQVLDFLTDRYGQFVLLKPRFGWDTAILWLAPAAVLLLGGLGLFSFLRRRDRDPVLAGEKPLSEAEQRRLAALLDERQSSTSNSQ